MREGAGRAVLTASKTPTRGLPCRARALLCALLACALGALAWSAAASAASEQAIHQWRGSIRALKVPGRGCFNASYPRVGWSKVSCRAAPRHPYPPAQRSLVQEVGNGNDYSAEVPGLITSVTGSFPSLSAGATETAPIPPPGKESAANTFSLQLNSNFFSSPACGGRSGCEGWQQFVYADSPTENEVFMQYWLLRYNKKCPVGWNQFLFESSSDIYCYRNSGASQLPGGRLTASELTGTSLEASADAGGQDAVVLTTPSGTATATGAGEMLSLSDGWKAAEFALVGDCCATQATFSANTTMTVQTVIRSNTEAPPTCVNEGFTGETNNLDLEGTPALAIQPFATMASQQTNGEATPASCATYPVGPPTVSLTTPQQSASYEIGQTVDASYSCTEADGATLESCTGTVPDGSPIDTTAGPSRAFTVTAKDTDGETTSVTHTYTVNGIAVTTSSLPPATRGSSYSVQLTAAGGTEPYKWTKVGALPKKLKLSKTGLLSGIPSTKLSPGEYPVAVKVTDHAKKPKHTATATLMLEIS
ncbi:MAG TPA: Ig domain-containing protein [Solirubrobacteraceae bacterium]|nr:Ig domain-containing protein [Solirubrobacteraceae bacterium]